MSLLRKLRDALRTLKDRLAGRKDDLDTARRRYKEFRVLALREHDNAEAAKKVGHKKQAERFARRAKARQRKAIYWRGRIKTLREKIHHLEASVGDREAQIQKWMKEQGVYLQDPNKIRGGTPEQRLRVAIHTAAINYQKGDQPGYYSQEGAERKYSHGLYRYPFGHIWDCSTFADAMYFVCGLPSPSGPNAYRLGGFTGTELAHGRRVSESEARSGDLVIYLDFPGDTTGHHVEVIDDPVRQTTIGHGDSAINSGGPGYDLFGDGLYEIRTYR